MASEFTIYGDTTQRRTDVGAESLSSSMGSNDGRKDPSAGYVARRGIGALASALVVIVFAIAPGARLVILAGAPLALLVSHAERATLS